jgi:acetyl-CoA carboxylase biotin carboxyl carrier protein
MSKSTTRKTPSPAATSKVSSSASELKTSEIRDLIDFISKTGLNEVNVETSELKLHIKREPDQKILNSSAMASSIPATATSAAAMAQAPASGAGTPEPVAPDAAAEKPTAEIKSPMIGTFYRSPNPDSPPFVSVGDKVSKGQTVCIIEAMKLFNEIESEFSGTIVKVLVENSTPVEYDQPLYVVEPD